MKKLFIAIAFAATFSACHYGTAEAQKTLETNEQYKSEKADYSVNRANVTAEEPAAEVAPATADSSQVPAK